MVDTKQLKKGTYVLICGKQEAFVIKSWTKRYPNFVQVQYLYGSDKCFVNVSDVTINEAKRQYKVTLESWK